MATDAKPLTFSQKLCYGLGDIAPGLAAASVGFWMLKYLTDVAGLTAFAAGIAIMIGRVWDAVTDPLMGWITDHTQSRWGKRRPYLLFGAIPYALSFFALWVVPEFDGSMIAMFAYVTVALLVFNTCLTVVFVPYTTLTAAITDDYNERTSLTGFRIGSGQTAFLVGAAVPIGLSLWVTSERGRFFLDTIGVQSLFGTWAGTERQAYFIMALLFALIMVAAIWITFYGTKEKKFAADSVTGDSTQTPFNYATNILEELQGNKPFQASALILLITNCASTLVAVNLAYYLEYVLDLKYQTMNLLLALFISAIAAMPLWVKITKRYGKAETYRVAMVLYAIVLCALPFVPPGHLGILYVIAIFAGVFNAAALMLPWTMIPDVIEYDELKRGRRREGLFYGGTTFCYKLATALAILISSQALHFIGYEPNLAQTEGVKAGIAGIIGPVPAALLIIGALISVRYPLSQERHAKIVSALVDRRKLARETLLSG